jgi:hypothetical protein
LTPNFHTVLSLYLVIDRDGAVVGEISCIERIARACGRIAVYFNSLKGLGLFFFFPGWFEANSVCGRLSSVAKLLG